MSIFDPVDGVNNLAIDYLTVIFGKMSASLPFDHAVYGQVEYLGPIFSVFNTLALAAGVLLVIYHIIFGTIKTSSDGKFLGERESGTIRIIQILMSIVMLIPTATGYCFAQIIFMHLVVYGVYAADNIWSKALDVMEEIGEDQKYRDVEYFKTMQTNNSTLSVDYDMEYRIQFRHNLQTIVEALFCAHVANGGKEEYMHYTIYDGSTAKPLRIAFGGKDLEEVTQKPLCGYLDVANFNYHQYKSINDWIQNFLEEGSSNNTNFFRDGSRGSNSAPKDTIIEALYKNNDNMGYYPQHSTAWLDTFINNFLTASEDGETGSKSLGDVDFDIMREQGWILAGNYYRWVYSAVSELYNETIIPPVHVDNYDNYSKNYETVSQGTLYWQYFMLGDDNYWCRKYGNPDGNNPGGEGSDSDSSYCTDNSSTLFSSYIRLRNATESLGNESKRIGIKNALDSSLVDFISALDTQFRFTDPFIDLVAYGYKLMAKGQNIIYGLTWSHSDQE